MIRRRYLWKFNDYEFPLLRYEYSPTQALRNSMVEAAGMDYALDLLAGRPTPKGVGQEKVRFIHFGDPEETNQEVDDMKAALYEGADGYLWTRTEDDYDPPRRALARLESMPEVIVEGRMHIFAPVIVNFIRLSDWEDEEEIDDEDSATSSIIVNNPGNAWVYDGIFEIRANSWSNIVITNTSVTLPNGNNPVFQTDRSLGASTQRIRFDAGAHSVEYSTDSGSSYSDDYSNYERPDGQVNLFPLKPGDNTITFSGTRSSSFFRRIFRGKWH